MKKRNLAWMLLLAMLLSLGTGCTAEKDTPEVIESEQVETETEAAETVDPYNDNLPDISVNGAEFTILHYDESKSRYYFDIEDDSGENIASAAFKRNTGSSSDPGKYSNTGNSR